MLRIVVTLTLLAIGCAAGPPPRPSTLAADWAPPPDSADLACAILSLLEPPLPEEAPPDAAPAACAEAIPGIPDPGHCPRGMVCRGARCVVRR